MERNVLMAKLRATSVSLVVWVIAAVVLVVCTRQFWYPGILFNIDGGLSGVKLIVPIDLVLGPVLMFLIFNPGKAPRHRVTDILVVLLIQIGAFGYGLYQVYNAHPVMIAFSEGSFTPVRKSELDRQQASAGEFAGLSSNSPPMVFIKKPPKGYFIKMMDLILNQGVGLHAQAALFDRLAANLDELFKGDALLRSYLQSKAPAQYTELQQRFPEAGNKLAFYSGRFGSGVVVFDSAGNTKGFIELPSLIENPAKPAYVMAIKKK